MAQDTDQREEIEEKREAGINKESTCNSFNYGVKHFAKKEVFKVCLHGKGGSMFDMLQFGEGSRNNPLIPGVQFSTSKLSNLGWGDTASSILETLQGCPLSPSNVLYVWINLEKTGNGGFLPSFIFRKKNQRQGFARLLAATTWLSGYHHVALGFFICIFTFKAE